MESASLSRETALRHFLFSHRKARRDLRSIEELKDAVRHEALQGDFPVDLEVYQRLGKDPSIPILFGGSLKAKVCFLGRDLGKDEVGSGQPLIGAGGRMIRVGVYEGRHGAPPPREDKRIESILEDVLLTNTVPYKPPGNKAYSDAIKERFRPFIEELLVDHWQGHRLISLGTEAFQWFAPYVERNRLMLFWQSETRFEEDLSLELTAGKGKDALSKTITLAPLPHPSPLNRRWLPLIPELLRKRLVGQL